MTEFSILAKPLILGGKKRSHPREARWVDLTLIHGTVTFGVQLLLSESFASQKVLDLFVALFLIDSFSREPRDLSKTVCWQQVCYKQRCFEKKFTFQITFKGLVDLPRANVAIQAFL